PICSLICKNRAHESATYIFWLRCHFILFLTFSWGVPGMKQLLFPSLRGYNRKWLRADIMAALVVAAIAIPQSLGYAVIAGVPVQAGLYCALLAPIVFAMFTSSRRLIVGAD